MNEPKDDDLFLSLQAFRDVLTLSETYQPRYVSANILPRLRKDLVEHFPDFDIQPVYGQGQKIKGYSLLWGQKSE